MPKIELPKNQTQQSDLVVAEYISQRVVPVLADMTAQRVLRIANHDRSDFLLDKDEREEKEKKACPTGGCPPDTKLNKDIYEHEISQAAKKNNLDLTDPRQRKEAHMLILPSFKKRVQENNKYYLQDKEGPPESKGPGFIIRDGGIYFPDSDVTMQQLYQNQKLLRPKQYDPIEHAAMTLMEQALVNGATYVRHPGYHRNENFEYEIRDGIKMELKDGIGTMEIQNISLKKGRGLTLKESYDVMRSNGDLFIEGHPQEGIFIFTDAPIDPEIVHSILDRAKQSSDSVDPASERMTQIAEFIENGVSAKIDEWLKRIEDAHIQDRIIPPYMKRLFGIPEAGFEPKVEVSTHEIHLKDILGDTDSSPAFRLLSETPKDANDESSLASLWRAVAEKTLHISPQQSEALLTEVQKAHDTMKIHIDVLALALFEGISIGAGIEAVRLLTLSPEGETEAVEISDFVKLPEPFLEHSSIEYVTLLSQEKKDEVILFIQQMLDGTIIQDSQMMIPEGVDTDSLIRIVDFIHTLDALPSSDRIGHIFQEKEKTLVIISTLMTKLSEVMKQKQSEIHAGNEDSEYVHSFSTAMMIWMLMKVGAYYSNLEFIHAFVTKKEDLRPNLNNQQSMTDEFKNENSAEKIIQKDPSSWLLFAIIWQMAMIREQGMAQSAGSTKQKSNKQSSAKKKTKPQSGSVRIPSFFEIPTGVIYAFSHVMIEL